MASNLTLVLAAQSPNLRDARRLLSKKRIPYVMHKRAEIAEVADLQPDEVFARYARAY